MEKPKQVIIKIDDDGNFEIIHRAPGVAVIIQTPDGAQTEVQEDGKRIFRHDGADDETT